MCPDNQLLSAYFDHELDEHWAEKVEEHLSGCINCRETVSGYGKIKTLLDDSAVPGENEIKVRLLDELERKRRVACPDIFWKRHLNVSAPVLFAAAAMVIVFFAALLFGMFPFGRQEQYVAEEITTIPEEISVQLISLDDAAAYILSDDSGFDLLITIPSSEALSVTGEPQLIREADFRRGQ